MKNAQSGSVHAIIIGFLTVALVAAVGVLFWQNVVSKKTDDGTAQAADATKSTVAAKKTKEYCAPQDKLCFDYPADWSVKTTTLNAVADGYAERVVVTDHEGKDWLKLDTGIGGVGGACGDTEGSYTKVLKTYTTKISGSYLVSDASKDYVEPTIYAIATVNYDKNSNKWTTDMELNHSKKTTTVGKIDPCDVGIAVFDGKNVDIDWGDGTHGSGAVSFGAALPDGSGTKYASESEAVASLETAGSKKAFEILRSARYE